MPNRIIKVRRAEEVDAVRGLVWEFFDVMRERYPDMLQTIDDYIAEQNIAGELEHFGKVFMPPLGECLMALRRDVPVGMIMLKPHGHTDCEMNRMYVREGARGHGIGRQLSEDIIREARALGYQTMWLDALYRHVEAIPLYESLGFKRHTDPDVFGGDDKRIIHMRMKL
ncbi:GNAT family N-acetyltransferase [uncultured Cohaesibacter sp.]|uniref:GNAT family N-acetyltransferase n=1 Tax=uncultured Cohaesibacter sp. TaxID=1002546 RepID=UPI0029C6E3A7|nr:GNAT family N-acetyltransferase [uncultured Cohaesibacter sp.]